MNLKFKEYGDTEKYLKGFLKFSLIDEKTVLLETDEEGLQSLIRFIMLEMINDSNNEYSYKHFTYLPQIGETDLTKGSLDFYIETVDGFIPTSSKTGKSYQQYGYDQNANILNECDLLLENNAYIEVGQRDNLLVCLSCNKEGFTSFCKFLLLLIYDKLNKIHLKAENKRENSWGELWEGSMDLLIVKHKTNTLI